MPTQKQYDVTLQKVRQIDCKIAVLNKDYTLLDEISGSTISINLNINADSDIRRTASITMNLKDDISQNQNHEFYWTAGNIYWFDKYVQIYTSIKDIITDTDIWVNQGIYYINSPSISYDAETNTLSFQAVDLISKMTGMRNGQLQGQTTTIPVGSVIKNAIETILLEQGFFNYILYDPPQATVPEDINIDAGGTAWDLLTQLRDINANWEMFFDVDGVFYFQEIPDGRVITSETIIDGVKTYTYGDPIPLVDNNIWDKILISASYDTNFEDVKNYIEVYGKTHEPTEFVTGTASGNYLNVNLTYNKNHYLNTTQTIEFGLGDIGSDPATIATPIYYIRIYEKDSSTIWTTIDIRNDPITVTNELYCLYLTVGASVSSVSAEYLGYMQARGWAMDNNPNSPFYVGQFTDYKCKVGNSVNFVDEKEIVITNVDALEDDGTILIDIRPWLSASAYEDASVGYQWKFKVHFNIESNIPATVANIQYADNEIIYNIIKGIDNQQISLDFSQDYMLIIERSNTSSPIWYMLYYPAEASNIDGFGTDIVAMPKFTNQVRHVCSGGEYDNIYSNDLAVQRAKYEIYLRSRLHDSIDIVCAPIYWLDVNQVIEYKLPNNKDKGSDYWLVKSISTDVSVEGAQTINAIRYYSTYA